MSKIFLVTGGSGFIGSEAVRTLIKLGHRVYNFDKLTYASSEESLKGLSKLNYNFLKGDIYNADQVKEVITKIKPNYILNFAAESHVDRSIDGPEDFIKTNIVGTFNLLRESYDYFLSLADDERSSFKFVHISTDEVYGSLDYNDNPFSEVSPYKPNSPYSASKASSDLLVRSWFKTYGLPTNITHSSNNYGPWQFPEKLIPLTVSNALKGNPIEVYGDGKNIRDWIFVKDHIDAILKVTLSGISGETFNIGGNSEISNIDLVYKICSILEDQVPYENENYSELITFVGDRPGHDKRYAINNDKIYNDLSWKPSTKLSDGLVFSIKWMLDNQDWLMKKSLNHKRLGLKK
jgi:dTDP-glucose 4,6-dehydratase